MTPDEFGELVEKLISKARERGLSDEMIAAGLAEAAAALKDGLT